jgi:hypothetical protein
MPDHFADLNKHLARLLQHSMKETDPLEYDKLGAEIWQVRGEQERLSDSLTWTSNNAASAAINNSIGTVALARITTVTPAQTTTYTIDCQGKRDHYHHPSYGYGEACRYTHGRHKRKAGQSRKSWTTIRVSFPQ